MDADANLEADEAKLRAYADELAEAIDAAIAPWVERVVRARLHDAGMALTPDLERSLATQARSTAIAVGTTVRELLALDIDEQTSNPLAVVRGAVRTPTHILDLAGVPPVDRDADAVRMFPNDPYDLTPGSFADVDPSLAEPGMRWGAAKAYIHLARRRAEGRR